MPKDNVKATHVQGHVEPSSRHRRRPQRYPGTDLIRFPVSIWKKRMHNKQEKLLREYQILKQEHEDTLKRRRDVIRDHQQQRQEQQELRKDNQELRQELQRLRRERREPGCERRDLNREYQELRQEHQELQCVHDQLKQDLAMVEAENKELRLESGRNGTASEAKLLYDSARYDYVLKHAILPFAKELRDEYNDENADTIDRVLQPLLHNALRAKALQNQLKGLPLQLRKSQAETELLKEQVQRLQNEMLTQVEKVQVISDEQFAQEFRAIISHVKTLSRSVCLSPRANMFEILEPKKLLLDTDGRHWEVRTHRKYYIEAWIWSVLLELVFATPFSLFGKAGKAWASNWKYLYGPAHEGETPAPSVSCEKYRCTVAREFARLAGRETISRGRKEAYDRKRMMARRLAEGALECRNEVATVIATKLADISSNVEVSQIPSTVDRAFTLALEMSLQKCRLQVTYPAIGATFHNGKMSSLPDLDGEDANDGNVAFVVNPGLTKWGDAHGKMLDQQYDIVPALVQLEPVREQKEHI